MPDKDSKSEVPPQTHSRITTRLNSERDFDRRHDKHDKWRFIVEVGTLLFLAIYTFINYLLYQTSEETFRVAERAYVSLGRSDGTIADLFAPTQLCTPGKLYFQNSGHGLALTFWSNIFPVVGRPLSRGSGYVYTLPNSTIYAHLERWAFPGDPREPWGWNCDGPDIGEGSVHAESLPSSVATLVSAIREKRIAALDIVGTFEYCDQFGSYHCKAFRARYSDAGFISTQNPPSDACPSSDMSDPQGDDIRLRRCQQPKENRAECSSKIPDYFPPDIFRLR
jgi:hypothetical protein